MFSIIYFENLHGSPALKVKLVPVSLDDPAFNESFNQSATLYSKYQMAVHHDSPDECSASEVTPFIFICSY